MLTAQRDTAGLDRAIVETPFGVFALVASRSGLRSLVPAGDRPDGRDAGPEAPSLAAASAALRAYCAGDPSPYRGALDLIGSDFQLAVWRRLLAIPFGMQVTYGELAAHLGKPGEARAAGGAVAANPIAILIPCHRVVGAGGTLRGYAWGLDLKRRLLAHEIAHTRAVPASL